MKVFSLISCLLLAKGAYNYWIHDYHLTLDDVRSTDDLYPETSWVIPGCLERCSKYMKSYGARKCSNNEWNAMQIKFSPSDTLCPLLFDRINTRSWVSPCGTTTNLCKEYVELVSGNRLNGIPWKVCVSDHCVGERMDEATFCLDLVNYCPNGKYY